jgi:hypothetical protein
MDSTAKLLRDGSVNPFRAFRYAVFFPQSSFGERLSEAFPERRVFPQLLPAKRGFSSLCGLPPILDLKISL